MIEKYEKYKTSNIKWAGKIPFNWQVSKIKFVTNNEDGKREPISSEYRYDKQGDYPYYGATGIVDYINDYKFDGKYLLIGEDGAPFFISNKNVAFIAEGKFWVNNHAHVLSNRDEINLDYLCYLLNCVDYREYVSGSTRDKLTKTDLSDIKILLPKRNEQTQIARYLDYQTSIIEELIKRKEKLIELLKEKRQAIINETVTKGLNPKAKMKDSGIDWLGEVPEGWSVSFLKRFCLRITDGAHFSPKTEFEGRNYISVKDVDEFGNIDLINCKKISQTDFDDLVRNGCQPAKKDVLLTKDGTIGRAAVINDDNDFVALSSLGIITPNVKLLDSDYLRLFLISGINVEQMFSMIAGAALTRLTIEKMKHLVITIPPINEQREIVFQLTNLVAKFDKSIEIVSTQIEKLKEYRQSIISEAVTGKIDVREWQPNNK